MLKKIADILTILYFIFSGETLLIKPLVSDHILAWVGVGMFALFSTATALEMYAKGQLPPVNPPQA